MNMSKFHSVPAEYASKYDCVASDGLYFYCTMSCCKEIHRFDRHFFECHIYSVCRPYSSLCYDMDEKCFWALSPENRATVYQLDCDFGEIGRRLLSFPGHKSIELTGIACEPSCDNLKLTASDFTTQICKKEKQEKVVVCKRKPCHKDSSSDLIESIALMEASLAHILNAEGEKLQKVIAKSNSFCEIMKVNDSVNQSIINATNLEKVLLEKLRIAAEIKAPHSCR